MKYDDIVTNCVLSVTVIIYRMTGSLGNVRDMVKVGCATTNKVLAATL
ncbi:MAG: hypothetical protein ACI8Z9_001934, partial [Paraglaciecola sp.]